MNTLAQLIQWTVYLSGFALSLQSLEYLSLRNSHFFQNIPRLVWKLRLLLSLSLFVHFNSASIISLILIQYYIYVKCKGPINGGSDSMTQVLLFGLALTFFNPQFGLLYIGAHSALSYFVAGVSKLSSPNWRSGRALSEFSHHSIYKRSVFQLKPKTLKLASWLLIAFEASVSLCLLTSYGLIVFMITALCFHLFNSWYFGLNRFVWVWLSSFPGLWYLGQYIDSLK